MHQALKATATMTSKGQVTIPKAVRDHLGLRSGTRVEFLETEGGLVLRRVLDPSRFDKWVGYLKNPENKSVDEIIEEMRGR